MISIAKQHSISTLYKAGRATTNSINHCPLTVVDIDSFIGATQCPVLVKQFITS